MRINNSIRTVVLSWTTQFLNFPPGPRVIIHMFNDPETGASTCLEDRHDSSPEQERFWKKSAPFVGGPEICL